MNSWREVAADRPGVGPHRDRLQPEPREGAQIGDEHLVVGVARAGLVEVEGIGVLHQELARAHDAEARADLVPELPLDVVEVERQVLVGAHVGAEDLGDHLLVGRAVEHLAVVPVLDAQHLLAVGLVAPALAPEVGRLDRRHQDLDRAGAVLLLADDAADLVEHAQAERQPGVDAGRLLADQAGAQHQPVRDDLGLLRRLAQDRQEVAAETHRKLSIRAASGRDSLQAAHTTSGPGKTSRTAPATGVRRERPCRFCLQAARRAKISVRGCPIEMTIPATACLEGANREASADPTAEGLAVQVSGRDRVACNARSGGR